MVTPQVRQPAVAGKFYPSDPTRLDTLVKTLLKEAVAPDDCEDQPLVKAVIAPHAGYPYSGPIAASAYVHLACSDVPIKRFILLGPAHFVPLRGLAVSTASAFATPLGLARVDDEAREAIQDLPQVVRSDTVHEPEHSLEVQLPFLQVLCPDFAIVPLAVGDASAAEVAEVLARLWNGPETRIVISSDLSHYFDYGTAQRLDRETAAAVLTMDPRELRDDAACGIVPIAGLLLEARRHDLTPALVDLRNSGDTGGPRDQVVGYGAFTFSEPAPAAY